MPTDERYLRFPRWLEASGLADRIGREQGAESWLLFRRLVEEDLAENLFPDWVDLRSDHLARVLGLEEKRLVARFLALGETGLLRIRNLSDTESAYYQYRIAHPLPVPKSPEEIAETLREWGLPDRPELWRYWEEEEGETKYEKVLRLYERTAGLKMSGKTIEDLVELAESHPLDHLEEAFEAARKEEISALGWIRKYLKRLKKDERLQKGWGRPRGLELPEGYRLPSEEESS
jgi:hypothetical protein